MAIDRNKMPSHMYILYLKNTELCLFIYAVDYNTTEGYIQYEPLYFFIEDMVVEV